jgi:hypothetical protein
LQVPAVNSLQKGFIMRSLRITVGALFILAGLIVGGYITLHYFAEGIGAIRSGQLAQGIVLLLVWSEVLGIASMLALVFPGVLVLRNINRPMRTARQPAQSESAPA